MPAEADTSSASTETISLDSSKKTSVEQQAIKSLNYLSDEDKAKALKYIESLITLEKIKNDQTSATKN
jgi:hypothetical protein